MHNFKHSRSADERIAGALINGGLLALAFLTVVGFITVARWAF